MTSKENLELVVKPYINSWFSGRERISTITFSSHWGKKQFKIFNHLILRMGSDFDEIIMKETFVSLQQLQLPDSQASSDFDEFNRGVL